MSEETLWRISRGKSLRLAVRSDGVLIVSLPARMGREQAEKFILEKKAWIERARSKTSVRERLPPVSGPLRLAEKCLAEKRIQERLDFFNRDHRFRIQRICIRDQRSRWGSCSPTGTLSFQYRLVRLPLPLLDYVVVHELCHLEHMNHSASFWSAVASFLPDYLRLRKMLKRYSLEFET